MAESELRDGGLVRVMLGEVPVVAIRRDGQVRVLADRCSHMSGSLAEGDLSRDRDQVTCPWHDSVFCLRDGSPGSSPAAHRGTRPDANRREPLAGPRDAPRA